MKKIYDNLMSLYKKHQEIIDYLFWGGIAFFLSMFLYWLFDTVFGMNSVLANTIDWVICVIFTYFTNKKYVFKSTNEAVVKEFIEFTAARLITLLLEDGIIFVGVELLGFDTPLQSTIVKFIGQAVVIISNYIFSKLWIFKKKNSEK